MFKKKKRTVLAFLMQKHYKELAQGVGPRADRSQSQFVFFIYSLCDLGNVLHISKVDFSYL